MKQDIFNCISIVNVKNKLNLQEIYSRGNIICVKCPFCFSNKGTMLLNTSNNSYICKNCEERGYSISLYAKCKYISNKSAYKILIQSKADLKNNAINTIITNTKKNDEELDLVYQEFLNMLNLKPEHTMRLLKYGFDIKKIEEIGFKSIPTKEQEKERICKLLIDNGLDLRGIPGFYQNNRFRWTFKSHDGIFVPVINNCKIIGLRIHLDKKYDMETTDIWFSSNQNNNGTNANNNIMILLPEEKRLQIMNDEKKENDIVVTSEMLLAYKFHINYKNKIIVGVPNMITNSEIKKLDKIKNINTVHVVMDKHTVLHNSESLMSILINKYGKEKVELDISLKDCEIPENLESKLADNLERYNQNIA